VPYNRKDDGIQNSERVERQSSEEKNRVPWGIIGRGG